METEIANLRIVNPGIQPGHNRVCLEIEGLKEDIVLFGQIEIRSPYLIRLIAISVDHSESRLKLCHSLMHVIRLY